MSLFQRPLALFEGAGEPVEGFRKRGSTGQVVEAPLDLAESLALARELEERRVGDGLVFGLDVDLKVGLKELPDGDAVALAHLAFEGREELGAAKVAVAAEEVPHPGILTGGDVFTLFWSDPDLLSAEEPCGARLHQIRHVAIRRRHEGPDERLLGRDQPGFRGGGQELARELDARRFGPSVWKLGFDPAKRRVAIEARFPHGAALDGEGAGESAVERVRELEVKMAHRLAGRGVHVAPVDEDGERFRERIVPSGKVGEDEADAIEALRPEPAGLEGEHGTLVERDRRVDLFPICPRLFDAKGEPEQACVHLGRFGGGLLVGTAVP